MRCCRPCWIKRSRESCSPAPSPPPLTLCVRGGGWGRGGRRSANSTRCRHRCWIKRSRENCDNPNSHPNPPPEPAGRLNLPPRPEQPRPWRVAVLYPTRQLFPAPLPCARHMGRPLPRARVGTVVQTINRSIHISLRRHLRLGLFAAESG